MIEVRHLSITLGEFTLRDVNLAVAEGEYMVIMGPTGSGKTVLVECIAGLYRPQEGEIWIGDRRVEAEPPEKRNVAYVPQDYCLFPHMTVRRNIGYGMRLRGFSTERQRETTQRLAQLLGIEAILDRRPAHLSGGEQQRVALARALAVDPQILLLDEPLAALDAHTRESLCDMLKDLQQKLGVTTIHVSHNLEETMRVADRVAVFGEGTIIQVGDIETVLMRPASTTVARLVGATNIIAGCGRREGSQTFFQAGRLRLPCPEVPEGPCTLIARPEALLLRKVAGEAQPNDGLATVVGCVPGGPVVWVHLKLDDHHLRSCLSAFDHPDSIRPGDRVAVSLREGHAHFVPG